MAANYKLVSRPNLGKDAATNPTKVCVQTVNNGYVQLGELGNFRMAFGLSGALTKKDFSSDQIRKPKIVFTPSKVLQTTRSITLFEKNSEPKTDGGADGGVMEI